MSREKVKFSFDLSNLSPFVNDSAVRGLGGVAGGGGGSGLVASGVGGASGNYNAGAGGNNYSGSISSDLRLDFAKAIPGYLTVYGSYVAMNTETQRYCIVKDNTEDKYTNDGYAQRGMRICPNNIDSNAWTVNEWNTGVAVDKRIYGTYAAKLNNQITEAQLCSLHDGKYLYCAMKINDVIVKNLFINDICSGALGERTPQGGGVAGWTVDISVPCLFAQMGDRFNITHEKANVLKPVAAGKTFGKHGACAEYNGPVLFELLKSTADTSTGNWKDSVKKDTITYSTAKLTANTYPTIFYVLAEDVDEIKSKLDITIPDDMIGNKAVENLSAANMSDIQASAELQRINAPLTIVIESGHGMRANSNEPGACDASKTRREHDLNTRMTNGIAKVLQDSGWNVVTIIGNAGYRPAKSGTIFNGKGAQISISVHNNAGGGTGYEFYPRYGAGAAAASEDQLLVDAVEKQAKKMTRYNYRAHGPRKTAATTQAGGTYTRSARIQTKAHMLIEGCYVDNPTDFDGISNNLDEWCNLVALGIQDYAKYRYPEKFGGAPPASEANA